MAMLRPTSAMKDSGIEWYGTCPVSWKKVPLYSALTEINQKNDPVITTNILSLTNTEGVIPYSERGNQGNKSKENFEEYKVVYPNTIVANSMNILIGSVGLSSYEGCVSPVYYVYEAKPHYDIRYLNYLFSMEAFQKRLRQFANGIMEIRLRVSSHDILHQSVMMPAFEEQKAIADYLDDRCSKIDEIIAEATASIEEYKNYRESIISNATTRGITNNREMKDSGINWLPKIPKEWEPITAKALFVQRKDRGIPGEKQLTASQNLGIIYQEDYMRIQGTRLMVVQKDFDILKHVEPDDFVISMRSFQGGLEYSYLRGCISSAYVMLIPNHEYVHSEYYKWLFKSDKYINALQSTSDLIRDGQALRYANFVKLRLFKVPLTEQKEIADYLNDIIPKVDALISEKQALIDDLKAYKKSLIYEIVTGKRRVV